MTIIFSRSSLTSMFIISSFVYLLPTIYNSIVDGPNRLLIYYLMINTFDNTIAEYQSTLYTMPIHTAVNDQHLLLTINQS